MSSELSQAFNVASSTPSEKPPISPLEGEMSGRTEGGADTPAVRLVRIRY
jgi:hypothetical protein